MGQVGEDKLVLEIGRAALEHKAFKFHAHDLILSMALAEVRNIIQRKCFITVSPPLNN